MEDQEIIELYWKRSEEAISETEKKYGAYLFTIAYHILQSNEDARECVNDAYFSAWRAIPPRRPEKLQAFLGKLVRNTSLNRRKESHAQKRGAGQVPLALSELEDCIPAVTRVEEYGESAALTNAIERFLYAQTQPKRNIFIRRYWYLSPIRELAKEYGMSQSKIKSLLFRMRKELKTHLEKEDFLL